MKRVKVSVGLPVYNGQRYLRQAIDSILSQTYGDFELVISDNASSDDTEAICRAYVRDDKRVRYYRSQTNRGAAWNYNRVFWLSRGDYFRWAAHDDLCSDGLLTACMEAFAADDDIVLAYPCTGLIDASGEPVVMDAPPLHLDDADAVVRFRDTLSAMPLCHNPIFGLMRKDVLARTSLITKHLASDRCLVAQLSLHGPFHEVDEVLFYRRKHAANIGTRAKDQEFFDPARRSRVVLPEWRVLYQHLLAVLRSPLRSQTKARCALAVMRWAIEQRWILAYQLRRALRTAQGPPWSSVRRAGRNRL